MPDALTLQSTEDLFAFKSKYGGIVLISAPDEETAKIRAHLGPQWSLLGEILVLPPGWRQKAEQYLAGSPEGRVALGLIHSKGSPMPSVAEKEGDRCPKCGARGETAVHQLTASEIDGKFPYLHGVVTSMVNVGWRCPECGHEWGFEPTEG